ncbi:MAG: 3-hydroxyacyl-CoA dehydrogenase NAD-binding domain-containing protein, partial [Chloroflexota bacterium]
MSDSQATAGSPPRRDSGLCRAQPGRRPPAEELHSTDPEPLIVGVVGAGTMGAGIAQVSLQAGHEVQLHDVDHEQIERGRARIADGLTKLVEKGRLTPDDRQQMLD